jgi:predicted GH43/DUF377 family glycosyl hydrolase
MQFKLRKWAGNPVLRPKPGSPWEGQQARNPAAILHDGKVHLIYTATGDLKYDHILYQGLAVSEDGYHFRRVSDEPYIAPSPDTFHGFDAGSVEDARIVKIDDTFYMTYMARAVGALSWKRGVRPANPDSNGSTWTQNHRRGGLLTSTDMVHWERLGPITSDSFYDANVMFFPEKINNRFVMIHRPTGDFPGSDSKAGMHICFSDDLREWSDDQSLLDATDGWQKKVGGSSPPIKTDKGWLTLFHGVEYPNESDPDSQDWVGMDAYFAPCMFRYCAGVMLLDLEDPTKIIARCPHPILEPEESYELWGSVNNVVFPCGSVLLGDELFIYYGGADTVCCVATAKLDELLDYVLRFPV